METFPQTILWTRLSKASVVEYLDNADIFTYF